MLIIADKGAGGLKKFQQRVFMGTKNVDLERTIGLDLTIC